jgi:hypothetical protein
LLAVEGEPVKVFVVFERFGGAAGKVITLAAAVIGKNGVGEGDVLEGLVGGVFLLGCGLVCGG